MIELFSDLSDFDKRKIEFWVKGFLDSNKDAKSAAKEILEYRKILTDREQEFVDFLIDFYVAKEDTEE